MFKTCCQWARLPGADRWLTVRIFGWTALIRMLLLLLPFRWVSKYLGKPGGETSPGEDQAKIALSRKIGRAVELVGRHTPWQSRCLVRAIAGKIVLRQLGIANTLYLGVRRREASGLSAHAWLRVGPAVITGRRGLAGFKVIASFGDTPVLTKGEAGLKNRRPALPIDPELRLLLWCMTDSSPDPVKISGLIAGPFRWELFMRLIRRHRVFPLAYKTLYGLNDAPVPANVMATLQREYRQNAFAAMGLAAELERVAKDFARNGVAMLVLKGPPLAVQLYGDLTLRPSRDLDILVAASDLEKAGQILKKAGYQRTHPTTVTPRQLQQYVKRYHHFTLFAPERHICLELHWKLDCLGLEFPWVAAAANQRADRLAAGWRDGEQLLFLIAHGSRHRWFRLRWLGDIERWLRVRPELDWNQITGLADQSGLRAVLHQTLILLDRVLEVPLPETLLRAANRDQTARSLARIVLAELSEPEDEPDRRFRIIPKNFWREKQYHWLLCKGVGEKLAYLGSLFEPAYEDFQWLSLPERLYPLYYLIRPLNWLRRRMTGCGGGNTL